MESKAKVIPITAATGTVTVHPAAAVFRLLSEDDLAALAADIGQQGLLEPIVVDQHWQIIDGRNRHAACLLAGVEPHFVTLETDDEDEIKAFIWSKGGLRRNVTQGQRAMAFALLYPEGHQGQKNLVHSVNEVGKVYVAFARKVLRWTPLAAAEVQMGAMQLKAAYDAACVIENAAKEAKKQKDLEAQTESEKQANMTATTAAALAQIEKDAPDLAESIALGEMTLIAAIQELDSRAKLKSVNQVHAVKAMVQAARLGNGLAQNFAFNAEALVRLTDWMGKNEAMTIDDLEAGLVLLAEHFPTLLQIVREVKS
jgi:hypothetical protein